MIESGIDAHEAWEALCREAAYAEPDLEQLRLADLNSDSWDTESRDAAAPSPAGFAGLELDADTADPAWLSDAQVIEGIVGFEKVTGWAGARQARLLAEFARRRPGDDPTAGMSDHPSGFSRWAPDEVGLALTLTRMTATARLVQARQLIEVLTDTLTAWETGQIDASKVRAITDACFRVTIEHALAIQDRVLPRAAGQTSAQLKEAVARAVIAVDPEGAAARAKTAEKGRQVRMIPSEDGMATILTAPDALTCYGWLTALARGLGKDDPRTMDQRRADLFTSLITGRLTVVSADGETTEQVPPVAAVVPDDAAHDDAAHDDGADEDAADAAAAGGGIADADPADSNPADLNPAVDAAPEHAAPEDAALDDVGPVGSAAAATPTPTASRVGWPTPVAPAKPLVQILMPFSTLIGADEQPVELVGYGPIPASVARDIAADGVWKRLVTDPLSGALLDHGRSVYRPPAALADFVRARDVTCRFPPCNRRALDSELDHTRPWTPQDGETSDVNLYGGCVHHHHLHHDAPGWTVEQDPAGTITWTTPTGHRYSSEPYDYRPEPPLTVRPPRPEKKVAPQPRGVLGRDLWLIDPLPDDTIDDAPF